LMYQMLTGRVPFTAQNPVDIILKHLHDAPVPPTQFRPDLQIAPGLEEIILKCMEKDRANRYQSMDELLMALKVVRANLVGTSGPHSMPPQYDTYIGARPVAPGALATPNTPPSLATPSSPMTVPGVATIPSHAAVTQPPPPPTETPASGARPVPAAAAPVASRRLPIALGVVAALAVAVAVVSLLTRGPAPAPEPAPAPVQAAIPAPPIAAPAPAEPAPAPQVPAAVKAPEVAPVQTPTALTGTTLLKVVSTPTGAEVRDVDDRVLGNTPFEMRVPSNKPLQLTLRAEGYKPLVLRQSRVSGESLELPATLKRDPKSDVRADPLLGTKHTVGYKDDPY